MTQKCEEILAKVCQMPVDARVDVACAIWERLINENVPIELTEVQMMEFDRRLAHHDVNPMRRRTWEEFEAEQLRKFN